VTRGPSPRRPITVIVPVYGDPESLERCVTSLLHAVAAPDQVLLVDDRGPDSDAIHRMLVRLTAGREDVRVERNDRNLGFVGTCNRAALELDASGNDVLLLNSDTTVPPGFLDELGAVLHSSADHGIVCPRSDNATIASLPHRLRDPGATRSPARTGVVHEALLPLLPRASVAPVAMGFCFLVRRELIDRFGFFDEAFAPGYGEENDFCLRMAREGFRSLIAHRVVVSHAGARSFENVRRLVLRESHERLLQRRHPGYRQAVREYLLRDADPVDVFADALVPVDPVPHLLLDLSGLSRRDLRTARTVVDQLGRSARDGRAHVTVAGTTPRGDAVFDLGVRWAVGSRRVTASDVRRLHADCLRWAVVGQPTDDLAADAETTIDPRMPDLAAQLLAAATVPVDIDRLRARWKRWGPAVAALPPERRPVTRQHWIRLAARHAPVLVVAAYRLRGLVRAQRASFSSRPVR
jgi:GT2 family glycosyltransferase